jgi:hypothetical protein
MLIYMPFNAQDHNFINAILNPMGGSGGNDGGDVVVV